MRTYSATIWLPGRGAQHVTVAADDIFKARIMLEAQFGKGMVQNLRRA